MKARAQIKGRKKTSWKKLNKDLEEAKKMLSSEKL